MSLSLSLSSAYRHTHTHTHLCMFHTSMFQIDSLHSHYLPFGICRHKIKRSLCCVCWSLSLRGPRIIQYSARFGPHNATFTIGGKARRSQINLICLFIVLLVLAAWNDSTMAQWAFSNWAMQGEIQIYRFGLSEPNWICEKTPLRRCS